VRKFLRVSSLYIAIFGVFQILLMFLGNYPEGDYYFDLVQENGSLEFAARRIYLSFLIAFILIIADEVIGFFEKRKSTDSS
jgi:hypothetical protein